MTQGLVLTSLSELAQVRDRFADDRTGTRGAGARARDPGHRTGGTRVARRDGATGAR